jgi:hypothetical protein
VQRAAAWSELMAREMNIRDPEDGSAEARTSGPDEQDGVWVMAPRSGAGVATVAGSRGPVGFELQVTYGHRAEVLDLAQALDVTARAEQLTRRWAAEWAAWVAAQVEV